MCLGRQDRVLVDGMEKIFVLRVAEVCNDFLQFVTDTFYLMVGLVLEKYVDKVWQSSQSVYLIIYGNGIFVKVLERAERSWHFLYLIKNQEGRFVRKPSRRMKKSR